MAPRSWRPDSSLADTVPDSEVQIEPVVDPLADMQTEEELSALIDAPSAAFGQDRSNSFMDDNLYGETPTPRYTPVHLITASSIIFVPLWMKNVYYVYCKTLSFSPGCHSKFIHMTFCGYPLLSL